MKTFTYQLPAYWASYLINGDASGLEPGEQATIDEFLKREGNPHIVSCDGEQYFSRHNDADTGLAGDVLEYTALVPSGGNCESGAYSHAAGYPD